MIVFTRFRTLKALTFVSFRQEGNVDPATNWIKNTQKLAVIRQDFLS